MWAPAVDARFARSSTSSTTPGAAACCVSNGPSRGSLTSNLHPPIQVPVAFRGVRYALSLHVPASEDALTVEVEEADTLARWRGHFSAKCERQVVLRWRAGGRVVAATVAGTTDERVCSGKQHMCLLKRGSHPLHVRTLWLTSPPPPPPPPPSSPPPKQQQ